MEYLKIKNTNLIVSRLGMGGCPLGGYGWGDYKQQDLYNSIQAAVEAGVTFFDTADTYGLGESEKILGKALREKREKVVIATKFGVRIENGKTCYDNSPKWVMQAIENSLRRLGTDYIDLYQVHYRDGITGIDILIDTLESLKHKGFIRYYGLSNIYKNDIVELKEHGSKFVSFQDEYSLACRKNESDIFNLANQLELTPFTWGSLGQGILTGKYDKNCNFLENDRRIRETYVNFHGEKLLKNLRIVEVMKEVAKEVNKPLSAIAVRFILDFMPNSVVLTGVKNPKQLWDNCEAFGWTLTKEQLNKLEEVSK